MSKIYKQRLLYLSLEAEATELEATQVMRINQVVELMNGRIFVFD